MFDSGIGLGCVAGRADGCSFLPERDAQVIATTMDMSTRKIVSAGFILGCRLLALRRQWTRPWGQRFLGRFFAVGFFLMGAPMARASWRRRSSPVVASAVSKALARFLGAGFSLGSLMPM